MGKYSILFKSNKYYVVRRQDKKVVGIFFQKVFAHHFLLLLEKRAKMKNELNNSLEKKDNLSYRSQRRRFEEEPEMETFEPSIISRKNKSIKDKEIDLSLAYNNFISDTTSTIDNGEQDIDTKTTPQKWDYSSDFKSNVGDVLDFGPLDEEDDIFSTPRLDDTKTRKL